MNAHTLDVGLRVTVLSISPAPGARCTLCDEFLPLGPYRPALVLYAGEEIVSLACESCTQQYEGVQS